MQSDRLGKAIKLTAAVTIVLMVAASLFSSIYSNPIFLCIWALLAILGTVAIIKARLMKRPAVFAIHLSFLLILAGAALTHFFSSEQEIHLREGETLKDVLPFEITLVEFTVERYPGTDVPKDYISLVSIDGETPQSLRMNHIVKHGGYRLYQSEYDEDECGSRITVVHDPAGIGVTYTGYAMLFVAFVSFFFCRKSAFRASVSRLTRLCCICFMTIPGISSKAAITYDKLPDDVAEAFDSLYVYTSDGRITTTGALGYWDENTMKLFPTLTAGNEIRWYSAGDRLPAEMDTDEWIFIRKSMAYVEELLFHKDYPGACNVIRKIRLYQCKNLGDAVPSAFAIECEKIARIINISKPLAMALLTIGILFFIATVVFLSKGQKIPAWLRCGNLVVLLPVSLFFTLTIICRWGASGHIPMSDGNGLMIMIAWLSAVLGTIISKKLPVVGTLCLLLCGFGALVSSLAQPHPEFSPVQPVLDSPLLAIHVGCMMISYTLLALAAISGMAGVLVKSNRPASKTPEESDCPTSMTPEENNRPAFVVQDKNSCSVQQTMADLGLVLIYPAEAILTAGIFIGAIWANVSWGTYWSWDPKETWALITMLVYSAALHRNRFRLLSNAKGFNFFCIFAFAFVLFTWFGVNNLLGGMHSYA